MALVDDRGRIGGKTNLIDALFVVVAIGLIGVALWAYLLFRTPTAKLLAVSPTTLYQGRNFPVKVTGENLRPFMRITFNQIRSWSFIIHDTSHVSVELPDLDAGTYDVVLWNDKYEISRLPRALTILPLAPMPTLDLNVRGAFQELSAERLKTITLGHQFPSSGAPVATVVGVASSTPSVMQVHGGALTLTVPIAGRLDMRALLRVRCFTVLNPDGSLRCAVTGPEKQADVAPGSTLWLAVPDGWVPFKVSEVLPPTAR